MIALQLLFVISLTGFLFAYWYLNIQSAIYITLFLFLGLFFYFYLLTILYRTIKTLLIGVDVEFRRAFDILYDRSPVAYLVIDRRGNILNGNPAAVNFLRGELDTFTGNNLYSTLKGGTKNDPAVIISRITSGGTVFDVEVSLERLDGSGLVWALLSAHSGRDSNEFLVSLVDHTQQKLVDTAKSEFVALATHQLRTPIAAIRWNVELLTGKLTPEESERLNKYLVKIDRNILRMTELINDFLSISKLEMGTFATKIEAVKLSDFCSQIADEFSEKINNQQLQLIRKEEPVELVIQCDQRLLHITISNLLSNATKYSKKNGRVWLLYQQLDGMVKITVADSGIGIPLDEQERLFKKFFRASNAQHHQTEGTGLGLYVVKQAVEMMGGTISVNSVPDEGTTFVIKLPI